MENITTSIETPQEISPVNNFWIFPFFKKNQAVFILALVGIIFYSTSLKNEYALDDGIIIHQNEYVLKGVRGIGDILTHDLFHSFYKRMNATDQLPGGRYRPLVAMSFAVEQEFIGTYRTGFYLFVNDLNKNGVLDNLEVTHVNSNGKLASEYEYNDFEDLNADGKAQPNECYTCWDLNKNFSNEFNEDLTSDGVYNEVDCQVNGADLRHLNNLLLYVFTCVMLYLLLSRYIFKTSQDMAFLAALLFLAHPLHSENVANVKGRDDIFSLLFIVLSFWFAFKFIEWKKTQHAILCAMMFFLALLSKEYGTLLLILLPLAIYIFTEESIAFKSWVLPTLGFITTSVFWVVLDIKGYFYGAQEILWFLIGTTVFVLLILIRPKQILEQKGTALLMVSVYSAGLLYLAMRLHAVNPVQTIPDTELLNNPFLYFNGAEKFATKVYLQLKGLLLFFFPHPLSSDYSYNTISPRNFLSWDFILSGLIQITILILGMRLSAKKHVLGFALLSYFLFSIAISNLVFSTELIFLEGNLFHASLGICIGMAWLIIKCLEKLNNVSLGFKRGLFLPLLLLVVFLFGCKTWERNWDWKNDVTLFLKDVKNFPNSVLILGNAGARWIDLADTKEITGIVIPGEDSTRFNDYNGTLRITDEELKQGGFQSKREAALQRGISYLERSVELHPRYVNGMLNLGLAHYKLGNYDKAVYYWKCAEYYYPNNPYLNSYYSVFSNNLKEWGSEAFNNGNIKEAIKCYTRWSIITPRDSEAWYNLGSAYFNAKLYKNAINCWNNSLQPDVYFITNGDKQNHMNSGFRSERSNASKKEILGLIHLAERALKGI